MTATPGFDLDLDAEPEAQVSFSRTELSHLAIAVALLAASFTVWNIGLGDALLNRPFRLKPISLPAIFGGCLGIITGFILHELAHKVVAQRYGHWAEFRAWFSSLWIGLAAAVAGFFVAAPGAVMIRGRVTRRENGLISLVGPFTNFVIALAAWPLSLAVDRDAVLPTVMRSVAQINALLCFFNLLPIGIGSFVLDGRKVWWWSKGAYAASMVAVILLGASILLTTEVTAAAAAGPA